MTVSTESLYLKLVVGQEPYLTDPKNKNGAESMPVQKNQVGQFFHP